MNLGKEEKHQLKKIIEGTGVVPSGLKEKHVKKVQIPKEGPVLLTLEDENKDKKDFELISVRKTNGLLGEELEVPLSTIIDLARRSKFNPWIAKIIDDKEVIFPFYHNDTSKVIYSPTFLLIKNKAYKKDKVDPYNLSIAGFLFIYNPLVNKNFLEAVSGSVVANVAVIEKFMMKHGEPYTRKNHILNWLAFLLSKDSKNIVIQAFSMHTNFVSQHKKFLESLAKKN